MELFVEPFVDNKTADNVLRYHFGFEHPDRRRSKILKKRKLVVSKTTRRGSGTESILVSLALPLLVAEADRQDSLANLMEKTLIMLKLGRILEERRDTPSPDWRREISERLTEGLEKLVAKIPALTIDKGRIVRIDEPWALLAIGDPRLDSYRLERAPSAELHVSGLGSADQSFIRIWIQEEGRMARPVYLPAWTAESKPSPAVFEMLLKAKPAKPLSKGKTVFSPKRKKNA